jgi:hypothetical protein
LLGLFVHLSGLPKTVSERVKIVVLNRIGIGTNMTPSTSSTVIRLDVSHSLTLQSNSIEEDSSVHECQYFFDCQPLLPVVPTATDTHSNNASTLRRVSKRLLFSTYDSLSNYVYISHSACLYNSRPNEIVCRGKRIDFTGLAQDLGDSALSMEESHSEWGTTSRATLSQRLIRGSVRIYACSFLRARLFGSVRPKVSRFRPHKFISLDISFILCRK